MAVWLSFLCNLMIFYFMIIMVFGLFFHYTPLSRAIYLGNMEIVKLLLTNEKININIPIKQPINWYFRSRGYGALNTNLSFDE